MPDALALDPGEDLMVLERVIVAPTVGVFVPAGGETIDLEGEVVAVGQVVGTVETSGTATEVRSAFAGRVMGMMARPGERVREGQPVAWLRAVA